MAGSCLIDTENLGLFAQVHKGNHYCGKADQVIDQSR